MNHVIDNGTLYLTAKQCVIRYNISLRQFQTLVARGDIPQSISFGCSKRWSLRALEDFESEQINRQSVFCERTSKHCKNSTLKNSTAKRK